MGRGGLPAPWFTQESVEERVPEDYGPQRWLVFDEEEWGRLLASPDPASFEGYLRLTQEQEELLASAPPVLVSGTAGSGARLPAAVSHVQPPAEADGRTDLRGARGEAGGS